MTDPEYRDADGRTFSEFVAEQVLGAIVTRGHSVRELARMTGISHTTLGDKFHGRSSFTVEQIARIALALNMEPAALMRAAFFRPA